MAKRKMQYLVSPKGVLRYPWLNKPDTKFNAEGDFTTQLILEPAEHEVMVSKLEPILEEYMAADIAENPAHKKWTSGLPFTEELDDDGEETGNFLWKFKQKAQHIQKDGKVINFSISFIDAATNPIDVEVRGGTEAKLKFGVSPYGMNTTKSFGLSLKPSVVQVIKLVEGGGNVASGFEAEEGYVGSSVSNALADDSDVEDEDF